jgi:hypothetical protein
MIWPTCSRVAAFVLLVAGVPAAWGQSTPAPAPAPDPQAPPAATPPDPGAGLPPGCMADSASGKRYCPGWIVEVLMVSKERNIPVGRFSSPNAGRITLRDHVKSINFDGQTIRYQGASFLNAEKDGEYSFLFDLDRSGGSNRCSFNFFVGNDLIIKESGFTVTSTAGARAMQSGLHPVSFEFACRRGEDAQKRAQNVPVVTLRILPPGDNFPREVRGSDILYELPPT